MYVFVLSLANQDFGFIDKSGELEGAGEWKVGGGGGGGELTAHVCSLVWINLREIKTVNLKTLSLVRK